MGSRFLIAAALAALVLVGISITRPLGQISNTSPGETAVTKVVRGQSTVRAQTNEVIRYRSQLVAALKPSNASARSVREALRSGNTSAVSEAVNADSTDETLRLVESLKTPSGLADARQKATTGLFMRRTAVSAVSAKSESGTPNPAAIKKLDEAQARIDQALAAVDRMRSDLEKELAGLKGKA